MRGMLVVLAAGALLGCARSAAVRARTGQARARHADMTDLDPNIGPNAIQTKHVGKKFVSITTRPAPLSPHHPGTTVELVCEAIGAPAPTIHWFKNDKPVYEHDIESNEILDTNPTSLARLTSTLLVSRTHGQDEYSCLATAGHKTTRATAVVYSTDGSTDLSERAKLVPLQPRVLVSYKVYMDVIGSSLALPCRAKGHPRPVVAWRDNKGALIQNDTSNRMKVLRSGELVISSLSWEDMGEFTCEATNTFGSQSASTFLYPAKVSRRD